ncbi:MAG TPA: hypothetical protein VJ600_06680 [Holophagaceae bacterium]|nr:hypothetical protein [Holophagaceae bacterium]
MPELSLEGVHLDGPDGRPVFRGLDLNLAPGEDAMVVGGTAFARGQLLKLAGGITAPAKGRVVIAGALVWPGEGLAGLRRKPSVGLSFGRGGLLANMSLLDNLELPLIFGSDLGRERIREMSLELLERFDLQGLARLRPHMLGMRELHLANLIRVKLLDPGLILLDDPFEELEAGDMAEVRTWMETWIQDPGRNLLVAADDPDPEAYPRLRRLTLREGRLMEAA